LSIFAHALAARYEPIGILSQMLTGTTRNAKVTYSAYAGLLS
jgi:hypothetical protein